MTTEEDESTTARVENSDLVPCHTSKVKHDTRMHGFQLRQMRERNPANLINTLAEMLVVMESARQHVITMHKNSNMGALCMLVKN